MIDTCTLKHVISLLLCDCFCRTPAYSTLPAQGKLGNVLGLTLVVLAGTVLFVVTNAAFKRVDTEELERMSLMNEKE